MASVLVDFLRGRGLQESLIQKIIEDKIDEDVLILMDDSAMEHYIPKYGDRLAAVAFCKSSKPEDRTNTDDRLTNTLERLRERIAKRRRAPRSNVFLDNEQLTSASHMTTNQKKVVKPTRRVEIGWMEFDFKSNCYRQIRSKSGGGVRHLQIERDLSSDVILSVCKDLFFPGGESKKGKAGDFSFNLKDFLMKDVGTRTVDDIYNETKVKLLRLYMCTKSRKDDGTIDKPEDKLSTADVECEHNTQPVVTDHGPTTGDELEIDQNLDTDDELPEISDFMSQNQLQQGDVCQDTPPRDIPSSSGTPTISFRRSSRLSLHPRTTSVRDDQTPVISTTPTSRPRAVSVTEVPMEIMITGDTGLHTPPEDIDSSEKDNVKDILTSLSWSIISDRKNIVNVSRHCVMVGALRAFQRPSFDPRQQLSVKFAGEFGIDEGGPSREFLRLLIREISTNCIFAGPENARILDLNYGELQKGTYALVGKMIAYSIVHRGPAPGFFSPLFYRALTEGISTLNPTLDDIADYNHREIISQLIRAENKHAFQAAVSSADAIIDFAGCHAMTISFDRKPELCNTLKHFLVLGRVKPCLDQFCEGLNCLGVLQKMRSHTSALKQLFCEQLKKLDSVTIEQIFAIPELSAVGSNRRIEEEITITNWRDYLLDIEDGLETVGLSDVLVYGTGSDVIPILGFLPPPQLEMHETNANDESKENFPFANTCANKISIPLIKDYNRFKFNMNSAIKHAFFSTE